MLDTHRLRLLREFAERGTIAATAAALGYTPSAVSQQLATLEREAGAVLLDRTARAGDGHRLSHGRGGVRPRAGPAGARASRADAAAPRDATGGGPAPGPHRRGGRGPGRRLVGAADQRGIRPPPPGRNHRSAAVLPADP